MRKQPTATERPPVTLNNGPMTLTVFSDATIWVATPETTVEFSRQEVERLVSLLNDALHVLEGE